MTDQSQQVMAGSINGDMRVFHRETEWNHTTHTGTSGVIMGGARPEILRPADLVDTTMANLNRLTAKLLVAGSVEVPAYLEEEPAKQLLPWANYDRLLVAARAHPEDIVRIERLWAQIDALSIDDVDHRGECAVATRDDELMAATVPEFIGLLRTLRDRAKDTMSELAQRAGISRSQLYSMLNPKRGVLPTRVNQVKAFAQACGLPPRQVDRVVMLWLELHQAVQDEMSDPRHWTTPVLAKTKQRFMQAGVPEEELDAALAGVAEMLVNDRQQEIAVAVTETVFNVLDENLPGAQVLFAKLVPYIVKMLRNAPERGNVAELAIEVGFRLGLASGKRDREPGASVLVI
ncbi:helix-turn-helix transcriptional regulator [Kutzneria buriramensis]|uniref:Helix-turn-helix protein n=1 Tax=Kutzneria buriramensis TaxID=1045776 RepID=A0A3E0G612_9PSEU|nr:helix-turn-helix transcriptional regulator [Kutzneria buriramensis]REH18045.1 helix-turn-helix protein [Kutzneria buriramensis]